MHFWGYRGISGRSGVVIGTAGWVASILVRSRWIWKGSTLTFCVALDRFCIGPVEAVFPVAEAFTGPRMIYVSIYSLHLYFKRSDEMTERFRLGRALYHSAVQKFQSICLDSFEGLSILCVFTVLGFLWN